MFYKTHGEQTKKFKLDFKAELVSSKKGKKNTLYNHLDYRDIHNHTA